MAAQSLSGQLDKPHTNASRDYDNSVMVSAAKLGYTLAFSADLSREWIRLENGVGRFVSEIKGKEKGDESALTSP
jgi:hypothetical protein